MAIGSINSVVAVLLVHIDKPNVANMKPNTIRCGLVPIALTTTSAILCSGTDSSGQLGDGQTANQTTPVSALNFP